jgi:serine/threonine-protein kinase RsbW
MTDAWEPSEVRLRIPSQMDWLDVVDRVAAGIAERLDFPQDGIDAIANSVVEAGTNAIQHGHRYEASLPVDLIFEIRTDRLRVRVLDRGPGFDAEKALRCDPTSPDVLLTPRGRGIFIMKSLMDDLTFEIVPGKGCTAILTKRRPAGD